ERVSVVLDQLEVLLPMAVEDHAQRPRARIDFRVFEGRRVLDRGAVEEPPALDDVELIAVIVPGTIEPGSSVEADAVDDQRVAFPRSARISHPQVVEVVRMLRAVRMDRTRRMAELLDDDEIPLALED